MAALGFGDVPAAAFAGALRLAATPAWVAFNVKEDFLDEAAPGGFAEFVNELTRAGVLRIEALRRYRHRNAADGRPLHYVAVIARKLADVPSDLL